MLNNDGTTISVIHWKQAIKLSSLSEQDPDYIRSVTIIDYYDQDYIMRPNGRKHNVPAVCMTNRFVRKAQKGMPFSRKNVYLRDRMTCQYCGSCDHTSRNLTFDHVIPRSVWKKEGYVGTPTNWTNIVTACRPCNERKADLTPKQAHMSITNLPISPNPFPYIMGLSPWDIVPVKWEPYMTPLYKHLRRQDA